MANIPSPIQAGRSGPGIGQQLLMALMQGGMQIGAQTLKNKAEMKQVQAQQAGLMEREQLKVLAEQQAELEKQRIAEETRLRLRQRTLANTPKHLRPQMELYLDASEAGGGQNAGAFGDLFSMILPPTEKEQLDIAKGRAEIAEINLKLRQARVDEKMRKELAGRIGLTSESVTDGMITEWMQAGRMAAQAADPQQMAERLLTTLVSRTVTDPLTGQANPAFSIEDAAARTEQGMQMFVPGFKLNMSPEQRAVAEAAGILRAAVAREKMANPGMKDAEIAERLGPRFMQDFPNIPPDRFQQLLTEAIKSNLLTGLGG